MTPDKLADELIELRRYCRTNPDHVIKTLKDGLFADFNATPPFYYMEGFVRPGLGVRLWDNIAVGLHYIQVDPEILSGYLYAAAFELRLGRGE